MESSSCCRKKEHSSDRDPLEALYFCLIFKERLEFLQSELVLGYLDDVAVEDTEIVLKDFILLESTAKQLGLETNRDKCELFGQSDDT